MKLQYRKAKQARDMLAISPTTNRVLNVLMVVLCLLTLAPFYVIIIASVTSEAALIENGYRLWPEEFSLNAYTYLFRPGSIILTAYVNTIISTVPLSIQDVE